MWSKICQFLLLKTLQTCFIADRFGPLLIYLPAGLKCPLRQPSHHTFNQSHYAEQSSCADWNMYTMCVCARAMWVGLCEASTQQSDDKYSQPSAPHELMDGQARNTGGLMVGGVCTCMCMYRGEKRGEGKNGGWRPESVCVCVGLCFLFQQPRHQTMPHGCNLFISYVINVHTHRGNIVLSSAWLDSEIEDPLGNHL